MFNSPGVSATLLAKVRGCRPNGRGRARPQGMEGGGMGYLVTAVVAMLFGFAAGLWSFKVKSRWCTDCGAVKNCLKCAGRPNSIAEKRSRVPMSTWQR